MCSCVFDTLYTLVYVRACARAEAKWQSYVITVTRSEGCFTPPSEFVLTKVNVTAVEEKFKCCAVNFAVVVIEFSIARQAVTYLYGMLVPMTLATFASLGVLMMPAPVSGNRPGNSRL